jgi:group I intron endonuclease
MSNSDVLVEGFARCGVRRSARDYLRERHSEIKIVGNDEEANCVVYVAVNLTNGKIYVGATEKGTSARRQKHLANAKRGMSGKFYTALRKYGADEFEFVTIETCSCFFSALDSERKWIECLRPEYNLTSGGGGVKGLKFSEESKRKMSLAKKGRPAAWLSGPNAEDIKRRLSENWQFRPERMVTDETKKKLRANARKANEARRRAVKCVTDGKQFNSVTDAALFYNTDTASIINWIKGIKSKRGLRFEYLDECAV